MDHRRSSAYPLVLGLVLGVLLTGLVLPLAIEPRGAATVAGPSATIPDQDLAGADGAAAGNGPAAVPTAGPPASDPGAELAPSDGRGTTQSPGSPVAGAGEAGLATGGAARRVASDRGITETSIKVGVILLDLTTLTAVGVAPRSYTIENQRKAYQAQFDEMNERGGIHGRRIEVVYRQADPFARDSALAACTGLTEDEKVFAVLAFAGFTTQGMLCVARQGKTPMIAFSGYAPDETYQQAGGLLVADGMSGNRLMFNWVHELDRLGLLRGKKIGIVGGEGVEGGDRQNLEQGLLPALAEHGYDVTYRARLSEDLHTAAGQIPIQVSEMRRAGVDTVLFMVTFVLANQWAQAADSQAWRPQYHVSDHQGLANCEKPCTDNMPRSFDGAVGITIYHFLRGAREGMPEPDADRVCREVYNRQTGERLEWGAWHPVSNACMQTIMFERGTAAAGANPTRQGWAAAVRNLGDFPLPTIYPGGFSNRTDYAGTMVTIRWSYGCHCFRTADAPRRARY